MRFLGLLLFAFLLTGCRTTKFYIVRHAEKETAAMMSSDVPLSPAGQQRAEALKMALQDKGISHIFSTNFKRTMATAKPLSLAISVPVEIYNATDSMFIAQLKNKNGNVLIVGHSNTVDELVNGMLEKKHLHDLPETQYGDLFIITKKGAKYTYTTSRYGL